MTPEQIKNAASLLEQLEAARSFDVKLREAGYQKRCSFLLEEWDTGGYSHEDQWVGKACFELTHIRAIEAIRVEIANLEEYLKDLGVKL